MAKAQRKVTLSDYRNLYEVFKVEKVVNSLTPKIGDCLKENEVQDLINQNFEVTIIPIK